MWGCGGAVTATDGGTTCANAVHLSVPLTLVNTINPMNCAKSSTKSTLGGTSSGNFNGIGELGNGNETERILFLILSIGESFTTIANLSSVTLVLLISSCNNL